MVYSHILHRDAGRAQRSDEYEWEYICDTTLGNVSPGEIAELLARSTFRPLYDGHAYTPEELQNLRSILRLRGDPATDIERLRSESDKFAVLVGWWVKGERQRTGRARANDVRVRLLKPSEDLLRTITDEDFAKEFSQSWGKLTESDHGKLEDTLRATINAANDHISILEQHISRGKTWAHDLTRIHVHVTACFCEYFDNQFEPSRTNDGVEERGTFQEAVELLAKPIFPERGGFSGAIREHIDNWNAEKRAACVK
jgi:hypothetical protein